MLAAISAMSTLVDYVAFVLIQIKTRMCIKIEHHVLQIIIGLVDNKLDCITFTLVLPLPLNKYTKNLK